MIISVDFYRSELPFVVEDIFEYTCLEAWARAAKEDLGGALHREFVGELELVKLRVRQATPEEAPLTVREFCFERHPLLLHRKDLLGEVIACQFDRTGDLKMTYNQAIDDMMDSHRIAADAYKVLALMFAADAAGIRAAIDEAEDAARREYSDERP